MAERSEIAKDFQCREVVARWADRRAELKRLSTAASATPPLRAWTGQRRGQRERPLVTTPPSSSPSPSPAGPLVAVCTGHRCAALRRLDGEDDVVGASLREAVRVGGRPRWHSGRVAQRRR